MIFFSWFSEIQLNKNKDFQGKIPDFSLLLQAQVYFSGKYEKNTFCLFREYLPVTIGGGAF